MNATPPTSGAQTISRAVRALRLIAQHAPEGMRFVDLARGLDLQPPTAHRLLKVLIAEQMLVRDVRSRRYTLGPLVFELGLTSTHQFNLRSICAPVLDELALATGDTSFLFVRSGNDTVCVGRVQGTYPIQTPMVPLGSRQPLGVNAGGLALLSCLAEAEMNQVLEAIAPRLHMYGHLDVEELRQYIIDARSAGFALIANRAAPGVCALGLPIRSSTTTPIAAVTVATTEARMTKARVHEILPLLSNAAKEITRLLQH
jgi:DNA-binding IclR family transcriptional regulator